MPISRHSLAATLLVTMAIVSKASGTDAPATRLTRATTEVAGEIESREINECSGIAASRKHDGIFWVHNDSGSESQIFAITRDGKSVATFDVDAPNHDWEDIAADDAGNLYIADVGNNASKRKHVAVYCLPEPDPRADRTKKKARKALEVTTTWRLEYPAEPFDCESFFVWKGHGYMISKQFTGQHPTMYRFALDAEKKTQTLEKVGVLPLRAPVTAASISPDGVRLAVLTNVGLSVFTIQGDPAKAATARPLYVPLVHARIEGCCFTDAEHVLVTAETGEIILFNLPAAPATAPVRQAN